MFRSFEEHAKKQLFSTSQFGTPTEQATALRTLVMVDLICHSVDASQVWDSTLYAKDLTEYYFRSRNWWPDTDKQEVDHANYTYWLHQLMLRCYGDFARDLLFNMDQLDGPKLQAYVLKNELFAELKRYDASMHGIWDSLSFAKDLTQYHHRSYNEQIYETKLKTEEANFFHWLHVSMSRSFEGHAKKQLLSAIQPGTPTEQAAHLKLLVVADIQGYDANMNHIWNVSALSEFEASQWAYFLSSRYHSRRL